MRRNVPAKSKKDGENQDRVINNGSNGNHVMSSKQNNKRQSFLYQVFFCSVFAGFFLLDNCNCNLLLWVYI